MFYYLKKYDKIVDLLIINVFHVFNIKNNHDKYEIQQYP